MGSRDQVRIADVDQALLGGFRDYVKAFGVLHDDSYIMSEDLVVYDPLFEPSVVALDGSGGIVGAASVMIDGYAGQGLARFRILHAADPEIYPRLLGEVTPKLPPSVRTVFLFLPEDAGPVEPALEDAGFGVSRRAYILKHADPGVVPRIGPPSDTVLTQALPSAANDWTNIVNLAFAGQPGRYEMTPDRARDSLARDRVIREGTIMAWRGGVPVGVVITVFDHDLTRAGEIETLAVTPANQGVGLGSALLRTALVAAADRGCTVVTLSVSAANRRALALYLDAGFTVADVRVCWEAHLGGIAG